MKKNVFVFLLAFIFIGSFSVAAQAVASDSGSYFGELSVVASVPVAISPLIGSESSYSSTNRVASLPFYLEETLATAPVFLETDPFGSSLRILSSLFIVIIIAFVLSWFIQKRGGIGGNVFGKVLGILPLDNRRMIYLVDLMGRVMILGVTENSINLLCEITDKDSLDALRLQYEKPRVGLDKLFSFLKIDKGINSDQSSQDDSTDSTSKDQQLIQRNNERARKLNDFLVKGNKGQ